MTADNMFSNIEQRVDPKIYVELTYRYNYIKETILKILSYDDIKYEENVKIKEYYYSFLVCNNTLIDIISPEYIEPHIGYEKRLNANKNKFRYILIDKSIKDISSVLRSIYSNKKKYIYKEEYLHKLDKKESKAFFKLSPYGYSNKIGLCVGIVKDNNILQAIHINTYTDAEVSTYRYSVEKIWTNPYYHIENGYKHILRYIINNIESKEIEFKVSCNILDILNIPDIFKPITYIPPKKNKHTYDCGYIEFIYKE